MQQRDRTFHAAWSRFTRLSKTVDLLAHTLPQANRLPIISFIAPVTDEQVATRCHTWQEAFSPWLTYDPQPANRLHITLHYMGNLRQHFWQWRLTTWRRDALPALAEHVGAALAGTAAFEVLVGPLNAFPGALIAEVRDGDGQLNDLRQRIIRALPTRASLLQRDRTYLPHITLGYWGQRPAAPLVERVGHYRAVEPLHLRIERVRFTVYTREFVPPHEDILQTADEDIIAEYVLPGARA